MAGKRGRPRIKYDPEVARQIQAMSMYGLTQDRISVVIGISVDTMHKLYAAEFAKGKGQAGLTIGKALFEKAKGGDTTAMIFWAKTQMGWREKDRHNEAQASTSDKRKELVDAIREAYRSVGKCS